MPQTQRLKKLKLIDLSGPTRPSRITLKKKKKKKKKKKSFQHSGWNVKEVKRYLG